MKPYPRYKDSGVKWIGEIPDQWIAVAIKRIVEVPVTDGPHETPEFLDEGVPFVSAEAIKNDRIDFSRKRGFISREDHERYSQKYLPRRGDIYMVKSGATTGNIAAVETDEEFNIWSPLAVIRPHTRRAATRFVFFFMKSRPFMQGVELGWSFGTQQNIGMGVIENLHLALPPIHEQESIGAFLDAKTAQIDELIEKKRRQIELLKEYRASVISEVVTKGLNPNVRMKDSGVEWIGKIPEHWTLVALKRIASVRYGLGQPPKEKENGVPLVRATDLHAGKISIENIVRVDPSDVPKNRDAFLTEGEIIVVRSGAYTGDSAIIPKGLEGGVAGYDMVVRCRSVLPEFLAACFLSNYVLDAQLILCSLRAAQPHLNAEELSSTVIALPPQEEQLEISEYLARNRLDTDLLIGLQERQIESLQSYRTSLISEAVTGKIDVRGWRN